MVLNPKNEKAFQKSYLLLNLSPLGTFKVKKKTGGKGFETKKIFVFFGLHLLRSSKRKKTFQGNN